MPALLSCAVVVLCLAVLFAHLKRLGRLERRLDGSSIVGEEDDRVERDFSQWAETDRFLLPTLSRICLFMGSALGLIALGSALQSAGHFAPAAACFGAGLVGALLVASVGHAARQRRHRIRGEARRRARR